MKILNKLLFINLFFILFPGCNAQTDSNKFPNSSFYDETKAVGGPFENGEFMYVGMPDEINSIDTSAGWNQKGQKLIITGTIFKLDGKTPAPNVILYYYHTDINGYYANKDVLDPQVVRHGYIRGWVKSDSTGKYAIYTVRPAPYPNEDMPAHIHPSIKEPDIKNEYYIDEFVFDDDRLLTGAKRKALENRGGSGVLRVLISGDLQIAEHNIILGLNIPNYPEKIDDENLSGLNIGEEQPSFIPFHAWGPDKGTRACPVCKYGRFHGIIYFVGNNPIWDDIKSWLVYLEQESVKRKERLKVYCVYGNSNNYSSSERNKQLSDIGRELNLNKIALTYVPSFSDEESEVNLNKIDPTVENTFIIFRQRAIIDKYVALRPTKENFDLISNRLNSTESEYFNLPEPKHD